MVDVTGAPVVNEEAVFGAELGGAAGFVIAFIDAEAFTSATREQIARQLEHSFAVLL